MADQAVTYTSSLQSIGAHPFVCKRCSRVYAQPKPSERPIRCECGWWYYNDGVKVREVYWQRLESYRMPPELATLFKVS